MGVCSCMASDIVSNRPDGKCQKEDSLYPRKAIRPSSSEQKTPESIQGEKRFSDQTLDTVKRTLLFQDCLSIDITVLGSTSVGKSACVIRYIENYFEKLYIPSITKETKQKHVLFNNRPYSINFKVATSNCDKAENERTHFFFVLFDLTSNESFKEAKSIYKKEVKDYHAKYKPVFNNVYLVGNKSDLRERNVTQESINKFIGKHHLMYYEMSVKYKLNMNKILNEVVEVFDSLAFSHMSNEGFKDSR